LLIQAFLLMGIKMGAPIGVQSKGKEMAKERMPAVAYMRTWSATDFEPGKLTGPVHESSTLKQQNAAIRRFAHANGFEIIHEFHDGHKDDISVMDESMTARMTSRPGFFELLGWIVRQRRNMRYNKDVLGECVYNYNKEHGIKSKNPEHYTSLMKKDPDYLDKIIKNEDITYSYEMKKMDYEKPEPANPSAPAVIVEDRNCLSTESLQQWIALTALYRRRARVLTANGDELINLDDKTEIKQRNMSIHYSDFEVHLEKARSETIIKGIARAVGRSYSY